MKNIRKYCLGLVIFGGLSVIAFAGGVAVEALPFPVPLDDYGDADLIKSGEILGVLTNRIGHTPFNLWASLIFLFAILHTFFAATALCTTVASPATKRSKALRLEQGWQVLPFLKRLQTLKTAYLFTLSELQGFLLGTYFNGRI